jgi:hypothetical protein
MRVRLSQHATRRHGRLGARLAIQGRLFAFQRETFANSIDRVDVKPERFGDLPSRHRTFVAVSIAEQQHPSMRNLLRWRTPISRDVLESLMLLSTQTNGLRIRNRNRHCTASLP